VRARLISREAGATHGVLAWSSFLFAVFQSICLVFVALNGLRLAIGLGALAVTVGVGAVLVRFHADLDSNSHEWVSL
jgi:hypothetical protein